MAAIVVRMTGKGVGAIAVVMVMGGDARSVVAKVARSAKVATLKVGEVLRTEFVADDARLDDGLVVDTGDDRLELHLHGGVAVVDEVIAALVRAGGESISPEEAVWRVATGDTIAAEVQVALPLSRTMGGVRLLERQVKAGLGAWARRWQTWLGGKGSQDIWELQSAAQWVLERSWGLNWLLQPARVAIVGPPNAGKSTLANALLGRPFSITSPMAGTTRDWVDAEAVLEDQEVRVAVTLVDTAGVRETSDALERDSILRTHAQAMAADVIVLVVDGSQPDWESLRRLLQGLPGRVVVAVNKMDVASTMVPSDLGLAVVNVSARTGQGLAALMRAVLGQLEITPVDSEEVFAFTQRQQEVLRHLAVAGDAKGCHWWLENLG